jgi:PAS domain S-box-containing protein
MDLTGIISTLTPLRTAALVVLGFTGMLLIMSSVLVLIYRARFKKAREQCMTLGPELKLTQGRLDETSARLENTTRKLDETIYRQQSLLDESVAGIFRMNRSGDFTYINSKLEKLSGTTSRQVLREGLAQAVHPEDRERVRAEWNALRDRHEPFCSTFRFLRTDGSTVTVICQMYAMKGSDQTVADYVGLITDVTDLHNEYAALTDGDRRIHAFIEETSGGFYRLIPDEPIAVNAPPEEIAERIYKSMSLASCNNPFAALYGRSVGDLIGARLNALPEGCGPFTGPESVRAFVKSGFKFLETEVTRKDARGNPLCLQNHAVGMVEDGQLVGIWGTQRNFSRQKRESEALDSRLQFLEKVLDTLPGDVLVKDTMCRFLYVNPGMAERTGIPVEDWIGKTVFEVLPATPRNFNKNSIEVMKTGTMSRTVAPYDTPDGTGWTEAFEIPMAGSEGLIEGAMSLSLEVTDRVNAELALQKSEEQFRNLMEGCPYGIILADAESKKLTYANPAMCDFIGYTGPELLDMRIADIHPPGSRQQVSSEFTDRARHGRKFEEALPCLRKNRSIVFADIGASMVWINGSEQVIGVYGDATERKKIETVLTGQNEYHLNLIRHAPALFAVINPGGAVQSMNDALLEKLGYAEEELTGRPYVSTLVSESDRSRLADAFSPVSGTEEAEYEHRLLTKGGEEILVECRIRPLFAKDGKPASFSMVALDITKRRKLEEQMQTCCDRLQEQLARRTADLEKIESGRQEEVERSLQQTAQELQELSRKHEKEIALESRKREESEERLQQSKDELNRVKEQLNASIEQRTQSLKDEIAMRKKREERLLQNESDLNQYRTELEASLQLRTQELEKQVAERKADEEGLRQMRKELKTLSGTQKELLAGQTQELKAQIAETKKTEEQLRQQEKELQQKQKELEGQIEQRTQDLESEAAGRRKTEEALQRLQSELQEFREQQENLIARETEALNAEIAEHKQTEEALRRNESILRSRAAQLEAQIEQRNRELEQARQEQEKTQLTLTQKQVELTRLSSEVDEKVAGHARDCQQKIEAVKQEEQLLQRSERHYRRLFESSAEAFLILDTETGKINKANPAAVRLFGADAADRLLGQSLDTLSPEVQPGGAASSRLALKHIQCAYEKESDAFEWRYCKTDGTLFCGLTSLTAMEEDGRHQVLAVIRNIDPIKKEQADLQQARHAAEEISRANSRFVADMQEAMCSSLIPVVEISAAIMNASNLSGDQQQQLAGINCGSTELLELMNHRLDLTRMAAGAVRAEPVSFDLYAFITEMNAKFCERAKRKSLFFAMSHAHNVSRQVTTDRQKLRKVLGTLLEYALDHTDKGRLGVHATREDLGDQKEKITFELAYTGRHAHDALLHKVFNQDDLLQQENSDIVGVELGLAISRRYAQMLGGEIIAESRPGNVCLLKFSITVAVEPSAEPEPEEDPPQADFNEAEPSVEDPELVVWRG